MCDYSLMAIPNRLAASGEDLVVHRFAVGAVGLASPVDIDTRKSCRKTQRLWMKFKEFFSQDEKIPAVCIPPGARLIVRDIPQALQRTFGLRNDMEEAIFTQVTATADSYRDALRFNNGTEVLLQRLAEGQRVRVLNVSSSEEWEPHPENRVSMRMA
jgi:hypothetical protein